MKLKVNYFSAIRPLGNPKGQNGYHITTPISCTFCKLSWLRIHKLGKYRGRDDFIPTNELKVERVCMYLKGEVVEIDRAETCNRYTQAYIYIKIL